MKTLEARVLKGRLILDEPTELPEGTVLHLAAIDAEDELDEQERAALHAALDRSWAGAKSGTTRPADEILQELKARR